MPEPKKAQKIESNPKNVVSSTFRARYDRRVRQFAGNQWQAFLNGKA